MRIVYLIVGKCYKPNNSSYTLLITHTLVAIHTSFRYEFSTAFKNLVSFFWDPQKWLFQGIQALGMDFFVQNKKNLKYPFLEQKCLQNFFDDDLAAEHSRFDANLSFNAFTAIFAVVVRFLCPAYIFGDSKYFFSFKIYMMRSDKVRIRRYAAGIMWENVSSWIFWTKINS